MRKGHGNMRAKILQARPPFEAIRSGMALLCALLLVPGDLTTYAQSPSQQDAAQEQPAPKIPNDQLDSLVAPIALYPGSAISAGSRCVNLSSRAHSAPAVVAAAQEIEG